MIIIKGIRKIEESTGSLRAFVDILLNNSILVKGCRVVEGTKGLFVSMPQTKGKDGKWYPIVRIEDQALYQNIQTEVLEAYQNSPKKQGGEARKEEEEF